MNHPVIVEGLAAYGYTCDDYGVVSTPSGNPTGVRLVVKAGRLRAESVKIGSLLYSANPSIRGVAGFLESFWHAVKRP